ncbi:unnamed protein product [Cyprideis torosa]|uniref:Uncharacterized protein n=1 Tax=Cyprideis torosa TaxID=163714 RepID=A0A7R8W5P7_9CRUS|nr:unnamed protein product [Cyprideis torosa]CAG0880641.1 unnamed protein product [Cyprideis torosa]
MGDVELQLDDPELVALRQKALEAFKLRQASKSSPDVSSPSISTPSLTPQSSAAGGPVTGTLSSVSTPLSSITSPAPLAPPPPFVQPPPPPYGLPSYALPPPLGPPQPQVLPAFDPSRPPPQLLVAGAPPLFIPPGASDHFVVSSAPYAGQEPPFWPPAGRAPRDALIRLRSSHAPVLLAPSPHPQQPGLFSISLLLPQPYPCYPVRPALFISDLSVPARGCPSRKVKVTISSSRSQTSTVLPSTAGKKELVSQVKVTVSPGGPPSFPFSSPSTFTSVPREVGSLPQQKPPWPMAPPSRSGPQSSPGQKERRGGLGPGGRRSPFPPRGEPVDIRHPLRVGEHRFSPPVDPNNRHPLSPPQLPPPPAFPSLAPHAPLEETLEDISPLLPPNDELPPEELAETVAEGNEENHLEGSAVSETKKGKFDRYLSGSESSSEESESDEGAGESSVEDVDGRTAEKVRQQRGDGLKRKKRKADREMGSKQSDARPSQQIDGRCLLKGDRLEAAAMDGEEEVLDYGDILGDDEDSQPPGERVSVESNEASPLEHPLKERSLSINEPGDGDVVQLGIGGNDDFDDFLKDFEEEMLAPVTAGNATAMSDAKKRPAPSSGSSSKKDLPPPPPKVSAKPRPTPSGFSRPPASSRRPAQKRPSIHDKAPVGRRSEPGFTNGRREKAFRSESSSRGREKVVSRKPSSRPVPDTSATSVVTSSRKSPSSSSSAATRDKRKEAAAAKLKKEKKEKRRREKEEKKKKKKKKKRILSDRLGSPNYSMAFLPMLEDEEEPMFEGATGGDVSGFPPLPRDPYERERWLARARKFASDAPSLSTGNSGRISLQPSSFSDEVRLKGRYKSLDDPAVGMMYPGASSPPSAPLPSLASRDLRHRLGDSGAPIVDDGDWTASGSGGGPPGPSRRVTVVRQDKGPSSIAERLGLPVRRGGHVDGGRGDKKRKRR